TSDDSPRVMDRFVAYADVADVVSKGDTRSTVKLRGGLQVDLRAVEPTAYGAALQYFTGSKAHNVELRKIAQEHGYKLNEYGLFKGTRRVAGQTEEEIYAKLGLDWIPPELREARGEIALARERRLPRLVELTDIRGDLQMHTSATDGKGTIDEMAEAARAPLGGRDRPSHRTHARQARALPLRLRRRGTRLRGPWVRARARWAPRAHGPARHARRGRQAARRPLRALDR